MSAPPRVVVTGLGVVSPLGALPAFWDGLQRGADGVVTIDWFDPGPAPPRKAARVRDWNPKDYIKPAALRRMDRLSQMTVSACRSALADAGISLTPADAEETGIVFGTAYGDIGETEDFLRGVITKGPARANPLTFPNLVLNAATGYVAIELGLRGPNYTVCRGEASGEAALACAYDTIASGQADLVLAGGGDEISPVLFRIQKDLRVLSPLALDAAAGAASREWSSPFDRRRNGFVMGEGAAILVLERAERAAARGARVYAELAGYATQSVASTPHDWPSPSAASPASTARQLVALGWKQPGVEESERRSAPLGNGAPPVATDLDLIVSCASSSPRVDAFETTHLAALLGEGASRALVTSVKGAIGEFGGAGAFSAAAATLALHTGRLPRLGALADPDPNVALRFATTATPDPSAGFRDALVSVAPRGGACMTLLFRSA